MNGSATPRLLAAIAVGAGCLGLAACGGGEGGSEGDPSTPTPPRRSFELELVIGDLVPPSGPKSLGPPQQKAANFAIAEINDAIGKADADHIVEIAHQQVAPSGAARGAGVLDGAECIVGPPTAREAGARSGRALAILTSPAPGHRSRARGGSLAAQLTKSTVSPNQVDGDAAAAFAGALSSFTPKEAPRGPHDARYFDAAVLCYLAAVGAGATDPRRMARSLAEIDRPDGAPFTWEQLPDAIEALERGTPIDYIGASGALDIAWSRRP